MRILWLDITKWCLLSEAMSRTSGLRPFKITTYLVDLLYHLLPECSKKMDQIPNESLLGIVWTGLLAASLVWFGETEFHRLCIKNVFCLAGRMGAGEKKNACNVQYRRPFGCAVLSIADLLAGDSKDDLVLKVYM